MIKNLLIIKYLDCIGDLYTSGYRVIAKINVLKEDIILQINYLEKYLKIKKIFQFLKLKKKTYLIL